MTIKSKEALPQVFVLESTVLPVSIKKQLTDFGVNELCPVSSIEEALKLHSTDTVYILAKNTFYLYQKQLNFMERFSTDSLLFVLNRAAEGGRH